MTVFPHNLANEVATRATEHLVAVMSGLTDEELEEERMHEIEKMMQSEAEKREERERITAEEAVLKARRQEEWVRGVDSYVTLGL